MRLRRCLCALVMLTAASVVTAYPVHASEKCEADTLAKNLHERLRSEGKSDAEIRDILGSGMKRRVMRGRVADGSGCTADQTEKALKRLEAVVKG